MTTIEKIRAEIERLKGICTAQIKANPGQTFPFVMEMTGYDKLLSFLSTLELESEKPMNQDELEKAVIDYFEGYWPGMETPEQCNTDLHFTPPAIMRLARHFAKWGAEHAKIDVTDFCKPIDPGIAQCIADHSWEMLGEDEKPIPKDLEEAVNNHIRKVVDAAGHPGWDWTTDDIRNAYIAGYKLHEANTPLPEDTVLFNKGVEEGKRLMMEEAVEGEVVQDLKGVNRVKSFGKIPEGLHFGDKVRIIVLPNTDEK